MSDNLSESTGNFITNPLTTSNWTYAQVIVLTLSEFELLKKVVKSNPEVKKVLNKFAPYIKLEIDF